jgi:ribosomal protein L11 methyltransferase
MEHVSIEISVSSEEESELLTAHLVGLGFTGFEEKPGQLLAFIPSENYHEHSVETLLAHMGRKFRKENIREVNWNAQWESGFHPVEIFHPSNNLAFAYVRATFHQPNPDFLHDLIIDPKMSFGTGHHATTHLMVQNMSEIDLEGKRVIDFGTGTGLLAILASKMGASEVLAIDCDDWSINNAKENFLLNSVGNVSLVKDDRFPKNHDADIILANINRNILLDNLAEMSRSVSKGGILLMSGIMPEDESIIISNISSEDIGNASVKRRESWSLIRIEN